MLTIWYSTETFADYIIDNTILRNYMSILEKRKLMESDANNPVNFHKMPDHIKKILYLDAPDLIVEYNGEPIFTIEISREAGTGHDVFQRFLRLLASVENDVPSIYIFPEGVQIERNGARGTNFRWDKINPAIFKALENMMRIHEQPVLLFYYPSLIPDNTVIHPNKGLLDDENYPSCPLSSDNEMLEMFKVLDVIIQRNIRPSGIKIINDRIIQNRRDWMANQLRIKNPNDDISSPITATRTFKTSKLLGYLSKYGYNNLNESLLNKREETVVYCINAAFRGDPYPGALGAIDYLLCRIGKTFEDRDKNLVMCWGEFNETSTEIEVTSTKASVDDFVNKIKPVHGSSKCLLGKDYSDIVTNNSVSRYYMQVRYGCTYTKVKEIRGIAYFADAILFKDGAFWREA